MRKIVNLEMEKERKIEYKLLIKGAIIPLVVGLVLIYNIPSGIFRIIGWVALIFGCLGGFFYLRRIYLKHEEKIKKIFKKKE